MDLVLCSSCILPRLIGMGREHPSHKPFRSCCTFVDVLCCCHMGLPRAFATMIQHAIFQTQGLAIKDRHKAHRRPLPVSKLFSGNPPRPRARKFGEGFTFPEIPFLRLLAVATSIPRFPHTAAQETSFLDTSVPSMFCLVFCSTLLPCPCLLASSFYEFTCCNRSTYLIQPPHPCRPLQTTQRAQAQASRRSKTTPLPYQRSNTP